VKADPAEQARLVELQEIDTALARLAARRRSLPEIAEIAELDRRLSALADEAVAARTEVQDLARGQSKLDADVEVVRARMARDQQRLDTGAVSTPRELESLQSEIESLHRRQTVLEDQELEVMETREAAENRLAGAESSIEEATAARTVATQRRQAAEQEIDAEASLVSTRRAQVAPAVPADLLALYDTIRAASSGVGAAALVRRRCEGCHLELGGAELREVKAAPSDEVLRCDNCRRILVRTAESGL